MQCASKPLFRKNQILPLHELITFNTLTFMYSVKNKFVPDIFSYVFTQNRNIHSYSTRQKDNFHQPKMRLTSSLNSLAVTGIKKWNNLPSSIKQCTMLSSFRKLFRNYLLDNL